VTFPVLASNGPSGYNLTRSLRTRASASAYLNRTFGTPTNNIKWTWSGWFKRGTLSTTQCIFGAGNDSNTVYALAGFSSDSLDFYSYNNATTFRLTTSAVYRDPAAWYHVVFVCDTANATSSDRVQIWVNGSRITAFSTATYPSSSAAVLFNSAAQTQTISLVKTVTYNTFFDGYLAEVNFVDGQALTASSFGSTNTLTGVWQPARYAGTYGANGYYLPFTDNSALTTSSNVGLGRDYSGNGNYWTTNNISITAGTTYDSMTDVPTLTSATAANFAVMNTLDQNNQTTSNGNLSTVSTGSAGRIRGTIGVTTGKYYWEHTLTTYSGGGGYGVMDLNSTLGTSDLGTSTSAATSWGVLTNSGNKSNNGTSTSYGSAATSANDIIMCALDMTSGKVWWGKNGTWFASGDPAAGTNAAFTNLSGYTIAPAIGLGPGSVQAWAHNFGQRSFAYTPPTGFVALNTYNLPDSTIVKGNTVMDATLYTGNSSTQTVTNAGAFEPDLVWIKNRSATSQHVWTDSVRGVTKQLFSSNTNAEQTSATGITSFNSNGFTTGANPQPTGDTNSSPNSFVAWQWLESASAGFDIVTFTGNGGSQTFAHGLGVAPGLMICKSLNNAQDWYVYHRSIGGTGALLLNSTVGTQTSVNYWANVTPGSGTFSVGPNFSNGYTYINFLFAPIAGFSAFGSYTGNGSADGTFVYTGFRPKFVLAKRTDTTGDWILYDTSRSPYNLTNLALFPNGSFAESTATVSIMDIVSNGFKCRGSGTELNASGGTYIYACFAENPFKNALAR
jgi:hypothetical protein